MTKTISYVAPRATVAMGAVGAVIGGTMAAARDYGKVRKEEMTREEAVRDVLKESGTTGLATATATAVVSVLGLTGLLSLTGIVVVAAGTKHLADKALERRSLAAAGDGAGEAKPKAAPKTAKAAKTTKETAKKPAAKAKKTPAKGSDKSQED